MSLFNHSCLVVAHPDDEILWFSSIISQVDLVLICFLGNSAFPGRGAARKRVLDNYPLNTIHCLELDVPLTRQWSSGSHLAESTFGLVLPSEARVRYENSYIMLKDLLRSELSRYNNVFTHNPWGEYGHEMHVQVHRVIQSLSSEIDYHVWFSNYVSTRTSVLAEQYQFNAPVEPISRATDIDLAHRVRKLYVAEDCWTVSKRHDWPEQESFNRLSTPHDNDQSDRKIFSFNHFSW